MNAVHGDAERLRGFAKDLRQFAGETSEQAAALRTQFAALEPEWNDENYREFAELLEECLNRIDRPAHGFWAQAQWLAVLADRYDDVLERMFSGSAPAGAVFSPGPPAGSARTPAASSPASRLRSLGRIPGAPAQQAFRLLEPSKFNIGDFDWGAESAQAEFAKSYHGNPPEKYAELAAQAPGMLAALQANQPLPEKLDNVRRIFFGPDRIHLEIQPNGKIGILNGRHRLWAALKAGISIPVEIEE